MSDKKKTSKNKNNPSTQKFLPIAEIRDDMVVLKDGSLRAVILVSSVNFALKSEDEQNAIIQAYTQFLNSFEFPVQIVIQSRKLDIDEYLKRLEKREKEQTNELLKMQTREYRQYITELIELADIMSKRFYVVVPYQPGTKRTKKKFMDRVQELFAPGEVIQLKKSQFEKYRPHLARRVDFLISGLGAMGLKAINLDTQSLIELYYNTYNPDTYDQQELVPIDKLNVDK
ncbi:conjugal transfer protein TraC [Patescibacteria group bacterium]|nr:conjugal transfer protein TraC [Patescibacteria group bacterium]MBU1891054.1 conjugal transfer protein TraC [Patescibacteria group bacterium]